MLSSPLISTTQKYRLRSLWPLNCPVQRRGGGWSTKPVRRNPVRVADRVPLAEPCPASTACPDCVKTRLGGSPSRKTNISTHSCGARSLSGIESCLSMGDAASFYTVCARVGLFLGARTNMTAPIPLKQYANKKAIKPQVIKGKTTC